MRCNDTIQCSINMHFMYKYGCTNEYLPVCIFMFIHLIVILSILNNVYTKLSDGTVSMLGPYRHRNVSCAHGLPCHCYPCVVLLKTRIVRILFFCTLPQTDNWCPTIVYRNLQCMSLWINVSGVLREHYTIESFYDWNMWFLLWCLALFLPLYWCFFIAYFLPWTGVWYFMNVFVFTLLCHKVT